MLLFSSHIGCHSLIECLEGQSAELGVGSQGTEEIVGASEGGNTLQKSNSVEEGEEEPEPSK